MDCEACEDVWLCEMTVYGVKRCRLEHLGTAPDTEVGGMYGDKGGGVGGCRLCGDTAGGSCDVRKRYSVPVCLSVCVSFCMCVCSCLNHVLTAAPIDLSFGMHTHSTEISVIGYIFLSFEVIKGHFKCH